MASPQKRKADEDVIDAIGEGLAAKRARLAVLELLGSPEPVVSAPVKNGFNYGFQEEIEWPEWGDKPMGVWQEFVGFEERRVCACLH